MERVDFKPPIYGVMAEFDNPESLIQAVRKVRAEGYTKIDAYTPFPVEGLAEEVGFHSNLLPILVLGAGIVGALGGFGLQYWVSKINYPMNIGGRPLNSWPSFIPVTFELTILLAALTAVIGMIILNGLPMPYHPVFNVPSFAMASQESFFLCVESADEKFDRARTVAFLQGLQAKAVTEVDY